MSLRNLLQLGLFSFVSLSLTVNAAVTQTAAEELHQLLKPINSLSADFTQQIKGHNNRELQLLNGNFSLKKPNQLRWNVLAPMPQLVVSDGKLVWLYDPDLEQVVIQSFSDDFMANPISILLGDLDQLNRDFTVLLISDDRFSLKPKQKNSLFVAIQLRFVDSVLSHIEYQDNFGQNTQLTLSQVKLNPQLAKNTFVFDIPQAVDIINHAR
jgi:outer membrane lipoprotein carrier protein